MSVRISEAFGELPLHLREAIQQYVDRYNENHRDRSLRPARLIIQCELIYLEPRLKQSDIGLPQADDPDHGED